MRNRNLAIVLGLGLFFFATTTALPGEKLNLKPESWSGANSNLIANSAYPMTLPETAEPSLRRITSKRWYSVSCEQIHHDLLVYR